MSTLPAFTRSTLLLKDDGYCGVPRESCLMQAVYHQGCVLGFEIDRATMVRDLSRASAYPHPAFDIKHIETHSSDVFLAGNYAYKIKKPVRFEFLDFTSPELRRYFALQELEINEALAPGVYEGVSKVCRSDRGGFTIDGESEAVEIAIRMKRLPDETRLDILLENGEVPSEVVSTIAKLIAAFHGNAERTLIGSPQDYVGAVRSHTEANFEALHRSESAEKWESQLLEIEAFSGAFHEVNQGLMTERARDGFVRDCHGDIHAGNVFLTDQIKIIDRIEFNPAFRKIDVASDIGFLAMDLARIAGMEEADDLIEEYVQASGDFVCRDLLPFFAVYRAMVRAKVTAIRLEQPSLSQTERFGCMSEMGSYFDVAAAFMARLRPRFMILMCGLSGSGKSTLARELAPGWDASRISSDRIRKQLVQDCEEALAEPLSVEHRYGPEMTEATYQEMFARADRALQYRSRVVLDATFSKRAHRYAAVRMGRRHSVPVWLLHSATDSRTQTKRLAARTVEEADDSEATVAIVDDQASNFDDVRPDDADQVFSIQTTGGKNATIASAHRRLWVAALEAPA